MKTAEEVAEEIHTKFGNCEDGQDMVDIMTQALTAFAEERVKENLTKCNTFHCESCHQDQDEYGFPPDECKPGCCCENLRRIKEARAEALEEAAEEIKRLLNESWDIPESVIEKILALKGKP